MSDYINCLLTYEPNIKTQEVKLNLYNMKFTPWENIGYYTNKDGTKKLIAPYWWDGYIKIKHRRITFSKGDNEFKILERNIQQANQKNVIGALAGLFVLEIECLNKMRDRFRKLFLTTEHPTTETGLDMFNNSIFQQDLNIFEGF